jgi:hypothetical protein
MDQGWHYDRNPLAKVQIGMFADYLERRRLLRCVKDSNQEFSRFRIRFDNAWYFEYFCDGEKLIFQTSRTNQGIRTFVKAMDCSSRELSAIESVE